MAVKMIIMIMMTTMTTEKKANIVAEIPDLSLLISLLIRASRYCFKTGYAHRDMASSMDRLCVSGQ
jgi:hypothetical protein